MTDHPWSLRDTAAIQSQFDLSQEVALADFFTDRFFRTKRWKIEHDLWLQITPNTSIGLEWMELVVAEKMHQLH